MNKQIIAIIMGIFLISLASALTYNVTAGEPTSFMIPENFEYYSIVGNQSEVNLNIIQEGLNITIIPNKYSQSDSFSIIFFNKEKEVIHHYSSGSSSTRKIYVENKTIEYVNITIPDNHTDIIDLTPEDLTPEEKGWWKKFWGGIKNLIKRVFGGGENGEN